MEHIFGSITTARAAVMWLVFPSFEIFADAKNACDPFGPTTSVSPGVRMLRLFHDHGVEFRWGGHHETSGLPVCHKGRSGAVLE
eukprot:scaffold95624_cov59-Attheya_sp.AAC.2